MKNSDGLRKQKAYNETTLYFSGINLIKAIDNYVKNQPVVIRDMYCNSLIVNATGIVHKYKTCYNTDDINEKIKQLEYILLSLNKIDTSCMILKELGYLNTKQYSVIILEFGKLHTQTKNFLNSLKNNR